MTLSLWVRAAVVVWGIGCVAALPTLAQESPTIVPTAAPIVFPTAPVIPPTPEPTAPPSPEQCPLVLESFWIAATQACIGKPVGYACNGGSPPAAEPQGPVSNALAAIGALVELTAIQAVRTPPIATETGSAGIFYLRPQEPRYTALVLGEASLRDVTPPDFPNWTSLVIETSAVSPTCPAAPLSVVVLQSPAGQATRLVVNGISIFLFGTVLVRTDAQHTLFVAISGQSSVLSFGQEQPLLTGQQLLVPHQPDSVAVPAGPPGLPGPFDPALLAGLPIALLDRPLVAPQPGNVSTIGAVNLRSEPSIYAGVITQVPGGEVLSVLGQNSGGDWLHVRRDSGETGWMFAELLASNLGPVSAVYDVTPLPPQRFGEGGTQGRVIAPAGVNLRVGPDPAFPPVGSAGPGTIVTLLARSPYSPWVKVEVGGTVGWIAMLTIETTAFFDALPIDFGAPPLPTPTNIPGLFGGAFPDPDGPRE